MWKFFELPVNLFLIAATASLGLLDVYACMTPFLYQTLQSTCMYVCIKP